VEPDWPTCRVEPCTGIRVEEFGACLAHLEDRQLERFLADLGPGSDIDARGTTITGSLLARLLDAVSDGGPQKIGAVRFDFAQFTDDVHIEGLLVQRVARFYAAEFHGHVVFVDVDVLEGMDFLNARFSKRVHFEISGAELDFSWARFAGPVEMDVAAEYVVCDSTRFEEGVEFRLDGSRMSAISTKFGAASSIASKSRHPARLQILSGTDVSDLQLVDVDLRECQFAGAYRLDQLQIAGRCEFNAPPASWRRTRRQTIVEEHYWRGWSGAWRSKTTGPERVAALYRSLRKALEDSKNEAGAGDFYYGEMDARRHSRETRRTERWILWFYWLLSGYGQRAGRALIALLVLVATVAILLTVWGQPAENAARIAVGAVVFRDDRTELTTAGEWTVLVARFLGPVLLALAVLAVRARVKR
jgi:hypothetical protein